MPELNVITEKIRQKAIEIGFDACGFSKVTFLKEDAIQLRKWLDQGHHADMDYMSKYFDKRTDPSKLLEGAISVISVLYNYYPQTIIENTHHYKISKYAYGTDYHFIIKKKLQKFLEEIETLTGKRKARIFVDSAPVLDKRWAEKSGLGWIGKNSCLITKENGSFYFIGEIILDLEFHYDSPIKDYCGSCTKCLNACPTNALFAPYRIDSRKCISFLTIENKRDIPEQFKGKFQDWIFGCDICQDVCPWNKNPIPTKEPAFDAKQELREMTKEKWESLSKEDFNQLFRNSPLKRTKYAGLQRNITFVKK